MHGPISPPAQIVLVGLAAMTAGQALASPPRVAATDPVCSYASHERLLIRVGRDVCAASLNRAGKPTAAGFMPTACGNEAANYRIDSAGKADKCLTAMGDGRIG